MTMLSNEYNTIMRVNAISYVVRIAPAAAKATMKIKKSTDKCNIDTMLQHWRELNMKLILRDSAWSIGSSVIRVFLSIKLSKGMMIKRF